MKDRTTLELSKVNLFLISNRIRKYYHLLSLILPFHKHRFDNLKELLNCFLKINLPRQLIFTKNTWKTMAMIFPNRSTDSVKP